MVVVAVKFVFGFRGNFHILYLFVTLFFLHLVGLPIYFNVRYFGVSSAGKNSHFQELLH